MGGMKLVTLMVLLAAGLSVTAKIIRLNSARKAKAAHKGEDKWTNPSNWEGLVDDFEVINGHRCHTNAQCYPGRWCSLWGWCQGDATYYLVPGQRAFVVSVCGSAAGRIKFDKAILTPQELDLRCKNYNRGCPIRIPECPWS